MKQLDWDATEAKAREMSNEQLNLAIADILLVLPNVREIERAGWLPDGAKSEGYYCDEASVYRAELKRRREQKDRLTSKERIAELEARCADLERQVRLFKQLHDNHCAMSCGQ
jgi:hypothetical protein